MVSWKMVYGIVLPTLYMEVSWNRGTPDDHIHFNGIVHYTPSNWGTPLGMEISINLIYLIGETTRDENPLSNMRSIESQ